MNEWRLLRVLLVVCFSCMTLSIGILDYPADTRLWNAIVLDPNGWWHETMLMFLGFIVTLDLTYWWENRRTIVLVRKRTEKV